MTNEEATIQALKGHIQALQGHIEALNETIKNQDKVIKILKQDSILDKIRAEIGEIPTNYIEVQRPHSTVERYVVEIDAVLRVLDKYRKEQGYDT